MYDPDLLIVVVKKTRVGTYRASTSATQPNSKLKEAFGSTVQRALINLTDKL